MRTLATDVCPEYGPHDIDQHADGLLATIADMPAGWHAFIEFDPDAGMLEAGCNLTAWRRYIGACARNLADRGLAETRRAASGMQLRLTPAGIDLAARRKREMDDIWSMIDLDALSAYIESILR
jgi:hypothetical protein